MKYLRFDRDMLDDVLDMERLMIFTGRCGEKALHGSPPRAADGMVLPSRFMINVHPQRWTGSFVPWVRV